jgi:hypothetical protein
VPYKGGVPKSSAEKNTAFTVKRDCIWRNNGRNQFIARLCRGIVNGDMNELKLPNGLMERIDSTMRTKTGSFGPKVGVIVDNVDHALAFCDHSFPLPSPASSPGQDNRTDPLIEVVFVAEHLIDSFLKFR